MANWKLVFSSASPHETEMVRGLLDEHDIQAVVMDQGSSVYPHLSNSGVYVDQDDVVRALYIVRKASEA